jgi:tRNA modification GTPase
MSNDDTVCAISTPKGSGAIAIVRISGTSVKSIIKKFLNRSKISERRIYTGFFKYNDNIIDKVNYVYFKGPRSYTGEDLLEIYCHGSISVQNKLLDILVSNGINIANPGEFTLRAILNNKMTLIEGEAINQLINNRSEKLITKLNEHINGGFSQKIENIREGLVEVKALVEAGIDFSDNDEISDELLLKSKNNFQRTI